MRTRKARKECEGVGGGDFTVIGIFQFTTNAHCKLCALENAVDSLYRMRKKCGVFGVKFKVEHLEHVNVPFNKNIQLTELTDLLYGETNIDSIKQNLRLY